MEFILRITTGKSRFIASLPSRGFAFTPFPPVMLSPMSILLSWGTCLRYSRSPREVFIARASKSTREKRSAILVPHWPIPMIKALKGYHPTVISLTVPSSRVRIIALPPMYLMNPVVNTSLAMSSVFLL